MSTPTTAELRELDTWIAEHVMGWQWWRFRMGKQKWCQLVPPHENWPRSKKAWNGILCKCAIEGIEDLTDVSTFKPTTDHAAAMQVLEKCSETWIACITFWNNKWTIWDVDKIHKAEAITMTLAICKFAKKLFEK